MGDLISTNIGDFIEYFLKNDLKISILNSIIEFLKDINLRRR